MSMGLSSVSANKDLKTIIHTRLSFKWAELHENQLFMGFWGALSEKL